MTLSLLIDLDDTLLTNDMDLFLPVYLKALGAHINTIPTDLLINTLLASTDQMVHKTSNAEITLEHTFDNHFYPGIGITKEDIREKIDDFYKNVFSSLQAQTKPRSEAVDLINFAFSNKHEVVIATNPLFPQAATYHRLNWANIPPQQYPFQIVSTYEHFHFCKPHLAYYAEILARLGWPEQPAVMIGNSFEDDILPAARLGLPTYWVTETPNVNNSPELHQKSQAGSLKNVIPWIQSIDASTRSTKINKTPEAITAILKSTVAAIDTLTKSLSEEGWHKSPQPEEWNTLEIICHLRDVDRDVNLPRLQLLLDSQNPFLPGIETDPWASNRKYKLENYNIALAGYFQTRNELLQKLANLSQDDWQRQARHAIFGPTNLLELINFIAIHDQLHIQQIIKTISNV